jgi:uncharacterized protein (TIGR03067 family)
MIQFGLVLIDRASSELHETRPARSHFVSFRGIIMMAVTNRVGMRATALSLTFFVLVVGAAMGLCGSGSGALADDKPQSELLKPFQGTWVSAGEGIDAKYTFEGEKLKATVNGNDYTCKVKIDTEAKPFATMDFEIEDGPDDAKGKTSKCIYKLDGEKFTLCVSVPGKDRPKDLAQVEDESYLFELKKEKK